MVLLIDSGTVGYNTNRACAQAAPSMKAAISGAAATTTNTS